MSQIHEAADELLNEIDTRLMFKIQQAINSYDSKEIIASLVIMLAAQIATSTSSFKERQQLLELVIFSIERSSTRMAKKEPA